ncbi:MAG: transposase [Pirellulaceae bacterium]
MVRYLARYLKGGPLSNHRIMDVSKEGVRFVVVAATVNHVMARLLADPQFPTHLESRSPPGMPTVRGYGLYAGCKRENSTMLGNSVASERSKKMN